MWNLDFDLRLYLYYILGFWAKKLHFTFYWGKLNYHKYEGKCFSLASKADSGQLLQLSNQIPKRMKRNWGFLVHTHLSMLGSSWPFTLSLFMLRSASDPKGKFLSSLPNPSISASKQDTLGRMKEAPNVSKWAKIWLAWFCHLRADTGTRPPVLGLDSVLHPGTPNCMSLLSEYVKVLPFCLFFPLQVKPHSS